jgi:ABC-type multidrug transport system fused ATPase/permease subunit
MTSKNLGRGHVGTKNAFLDDEEQYGSVYEHSVVSRLFSYLGPFKVQAVWALIGTLVFMGSSVALPWMVGYAFDAYIAGGDWNGLIILCMVFFAVAIVGAIGNRVQMLEMARIGQGLILILRTELFRHLQTLSMSFWDRSQIGRIMSRVTNDVNQIQEVMTQGLVGTISQLFILVAMIFMMFRMDLILAIGAMAPIPILIMAVAVWQSRARDAFVWVRTAIAVVNGTLNENLSGARTVQSHRREAANMLDFDQINEDHLNANIAAARLSGIMMPVVEIQSSLSLAIIILLGGLRVHSGEMSMGELVAFFLYAQRIFEPLRMIIMQYTELQRAMAGGVRIFELMDTRSDVVDQPGARPIAISKGRIDFEQVALEYLPGVRILDNIDVSVLPGETVALVGATGAGKTSFVNLIGRMYDVTEGSIKIDGQDVREIQQRTIAQGMGVVLQDPFLFSASVKENILFGRTDATDEEVMRAAETVGVHDFIMSLTDGYETVLEERGENLSLGQRQLVSFARAVLADPMILILDEATANVDTLAEAAIQKALRVLLYGRTSVVIAHRLSTIREADRILVLDHGALVEQGSHSELMLLDGIYARLYLMTYKSQDDSLIS